MQIVSGELSGAGETSAPTTHSGTPSKHDGDGARHQAGHSVEGAGAVAPRLEVVDRHDVLILVLRDVALPSAVLHVE